LKEVQETLRKAQRNGEEENVLRLTARFQELSRQRENLKRGALDSQG